MTQEPSIAEQFRQAYADIEEVDRGIKLEYRYRCGLTDRKTAKELGCGDLFFESPDRQNLDLYYGLRKLGWARKKPMVPHHWVVSRLGVKILFSEGDIYVRHNRP